MGTTTHATGPTDPPVTGVGGELRARRIHPHAAAPEGTDPATVRLVFLLRTYPDLVPVRAEDVPALDAAARSALLARLDRALGLDAPVPPILRADG